MQKKSIPSATEILYIPTNPTSYLFLTSWLPIPSPPVSCLLHHHLSLAGPSSCETCDSGACGDDGGGSGGSIVRRCGCGSCDGVMPSDEG